MMMSYEFSINLDLDEFKRMLWWQAHTTKTMNKSDEKLKFKLELIVESLEEEERILKEDEEDCE